MDKVKTEVILTNGKRVSFDLHHGILDFKIESNVSVERAKLGIEEAVLRQALATLDAVETKNVELAQIFKFIDYSTSFKDE